ncbi:glycosyltransferase family 10 domain-containing protein [Telluria beijingensis]|uniref:glycosyltransferase family 10 domain-containing protein n=1 Tax=Telluria beijingensis TaxID=3068633 RepID=UPI0027962E70|nr:glycosyltransferase family 10 [Massilia sp. REN29]
MGRHAHRTPVSYPEYRALFSREIIYATSAEEADIILFGFVIDIRENAEALLQLRNKKPGIKFVVLSEEPLWDTMWSGDFLAKTCNVSIGQSTIAYTFLNHCTTSIYKFNNFPYFITTSDEFFARYRYYFLRNKNYSRDEIEAYWKDAIIRIAFYSERRAKKDFDIKYFDNDVVRLSGLRSEVAERAIGDGVHRVGQGWGIATKRQALPDWHLDKLVALDRKAYIVSAMENTHQEFYITEKIFDAFAVLGIPIYFSSKGNAVSRLLPHGGFLNLYGFSADECIANIHSFKPDANFIENYKKTQQDLAGLFSDAQLYVQERKRVVDEVVKELHRLMA